MKTVTTMMIVFIAANLMSFNNPVVEDIPMVEHTERSEEAIVEEAIVEESISADVTATMYYAVESQCDADPLITAGMYEIDPHNASDHRWIAMSRDLLKRWGGEFDYGDKVVISGTDHKDGIYTVVDTMNKRFTNKIDILETKGTPLYKYDNVKVVKI